MFPTDIPPAKYWNCWEPLTIGIILLKKEEDKREISILFYKRITNFHYIHLFNIREIWRVLYPQLLTKMKIWNGNEQCSTTPPHTARELLLKNDYNFVVE